MPGPIRKRLPPRYHRGLSLLEVIIATVVLATSAVMLVRLLDTADQNAQRAERRVTAQMICQNRMDQILAAIEPLEPGDPRRSLHYPDWQTSVTLSPLPETGEDGRDRLVLVEVSVFHQPAEEAFGEELAADPENEVPVFSLRRIVRQSGNAVETGNRFSSGSFRQ